MNTQISKKTVETEALVNNNSDTIFAAAVAANVREQAIDEALFAAEIAAKAREQSIDEALFTAGIAIKAEEKSIDNALSVYTKHNSETDFDKDNEDFEDEIDWDNGYEWTEEDSWNALTDGMYGEMPRNPFEYDAMMDAMGF